MKFNTNILLFPRKHASYVRKLCLCGKERKSPRKLWSAGKKTKKKRKRSGLNFRIFSIRRCSLLEKNREKGSLFLGSIQQTETSKLMRAACLHVLLGCFSLASAPSFHTSHNNADFVLGLLSSGISQRLFWGKIKAKKAQENRVCGGKEKGRNFSQSPNRRRVFSPL